jgi:nucleoside phosphorylase
MEESFFDALLADTLTAEVRENAFPTTDVHQLPAIDWSDIPDFQPQPVQAGLVEPNAPLPQAEVVIMTWTKAEWAALHHVFCAYDKPMTPSEASGENNHAWNKSWIPYRRDYHQVHQYMTDVKRTYQGGAPSLGEMAWGSYRLVTVNQRRVLLIKSGMHLAQDGTDLPLTSFVDRICAEAKPRLVLSIGTAGGVRPEDALGCALITNQAYFYLLKAFAGASYNGTTVMSDWQPKTDFIEAAQRRALQVSGFPVLPLSPQYPKDAVIKPDAPNSEIKIVTDSPIITTDTFLFGTTKNELAKLGCIVEMDDAVVGMRCAAAGVDFGFVRNVSDPVINADLPSAVQRVWAGYIYEQLGLFTSYNGALAAWALVAAEFRQ